MCVSEVIECWGSLCSHLDRKVLTQSRLVIVISNLTLRIWGDYRRTSIEAVKAARGNEVPDVRDDGMLRRKVNVLARPKLLPAGETIV